MSSRPNGCVCVCNFQKKKKKDKNDRVDSLFSLERPSKLLHTYQLVENTTMNMLCYKKQLERKREHFGIYDLPLLLTEQKHLTPSKYFTILNTLSPQRFSLLSIT